LDRSAEVTTLEVIAIAGHGAGVVLSMLGVAFHVAKERTLKDRDVAVHSLALLYHLNALRKHAKRL
jgi:hypothetical protein